MTVEPASLLGGRYLVGALVGRGGMADVHRAHDEVLDRAVAVKLFRDPLGDGTDGGRGPLAELVRAECRTLARLNHPGLVQVYDAGLQTDLGRSYLVMELVEGPTLAQCCVDGSLGPERVAAVGADLAEALDYVHRQGVVHRDLKPANVIVAGDGTVKLADFGIARLVDSARHTQTGLTVGTAHYLAPEQVRGEDVGPPTDVYGLGLVLLECLTGRREYDGQPVEAALARLTRPPAVPASLPPGWAPLLTAMTALEPRDRPTAVAASASLRRLADGTAAAVDLAPTAVLGGTAVLPVAAPRRPTGPTRATPTSSSTAARTGPLPPRPASSPRNGAGANRTALMLGAALLLLLLVVVLAVRAVGSGAPPPTPGPAPSGSQLERDLAELRESVTP